MPFILDAFAVLGTAVLFIGGIAMLAACGIVFFRALRELAGARAALSAAQAQEETVRAGHDAVDEIKERREYIRREPSYPTDAELRQAAYDQTLEELGVDGSEMPESYTTVDDHAARIGANGQADIPPDSLYEPVSER